MRLRVPWSLAALAALLAAGSAQAVPIAVSAELRLHMLAGEPDIVATGTGTIDVSGGVYTIPAGLVSAQLLTVPLSTVGPPPYFMVAEGISNLSGTFAPAGVASQAPAEICPMAPLGQACVSGGGFGGLMGLTGVVNLHVIPHLIVMPIQLGETRIGQGGSGSAPAYTFGGMPTTNRFDGAPWTTRTVRVAALGSHVGSAGTNALTLVSGSYVLAQGNQIPFWASFTITPLVPEPAALVLVVLGTVGLIALARGRR